MLLFLYLTCSSQPSQADDQSAQTCAMEQYGAVVCAIHVVLHCTIFVRCGWFEVYQNVKCCGKGGIVKFTAIRSDHSTTKPLQERKSSLSQFYSVLFSLKTVKKGLILGKLFWSNRIELRIQN